MSYHPQSKFGLITKDGLDYTDKLQEKTSENLKNAIRDLEDTRTVP